MNYFKAAEQVLSSVPALEQALDNLKRREQRLLDSGKPRELGGVDYGKPFTDTSHVSDTLNEMLAVAECEKDLAETRAKLEEIHGILEQLSEDKKKVLLLWYMKKCRKEAILEELRVESLVTVYNLRNRAVAEFALLYYGAPALASI